MRGFFRKALLAALALGALAALAYFSRRKIHLGDFTWSRFTHAVGQANIWLLLISIVAVYGAYALRTLRWQRLSRHLGPTKFLDVYSATLMGFASIFILGRPGELVRPLLLARKSHQPVASMFGVWLLERHHRYWRRRRVGGAEPACVFAEKLADAGLNTDWVENARAGGWLLLGGLAAVVVLMIYFRLHGAGVLQRRLHYWHDAGGFRHWLAEIIAGFSEGLQAIRTTSDLLITVVYTAAHWGLVTLSYFWIAKAFESAFVQSDVTFPGAMLLLAITLVGSVLQLPGVGGGAQLASFIRTHHNFWSRAGACGRYCYRLVAYHICVTDIGWCPLADSRRIVHGRAAQPCASRESGRTRREARFLDARRRQPFERRPGERG